ncbi:MAG: DUF5076 domain-containing protein [Pirellulales bacterium]
MAHTNELPIPPIANSTANSRELLRVWAAEGKQHVTLATGLWNDPANWGILLVDLMKHISNAYEQTSEQTAEECFQRILTGLHAELSHATDEPNVELLH